MPQAQFVSFQNGTDTHQLARFNSTFFAPPGDSSSESRFIRLAMLNLAAGLRGWPMDEGFSPNGTFAGGYPAKVVSSSSSSAHQRITLESASADKPDALPCLHPFRLPSKHPPRWHAASYAQGLWAMTEIILGMSVLAPGLDDGGGAGTGPDYTQVPCPACGQPPVLPGACACERWRRTRMRA